MHPSPPEQSKGSRSSCAPRNEVSSVPSLGWAHGGQLLSLHSLQLQRPCHVAPRTSAAWRPQDANRLVVTPGNGHALARGQGGKGSVRSTMQRFLVSCVIGTSRCLAGMSRAAARKAAKNKTNRFWGCKPLTHSKRLCYEAKHKGGLSVSYREGRGTYTSLGVGGGGDSAFL